jgi:hypothetical protein
MPGPCGVRGTAAIAGNVTVGPCCATVGPRLRGRRGVGHWKNQSNEAVDSNVLRATRLMRVFMQQLEAMQKLKGKAGGDCEA